MIFQANAFYICIASNTSITYNQLFCSIRPLINKPLTIFNGYRLFYNINNRIMYSLYDPKWYIYFRFQLKELVSTSSERPPTHNHMTLFRQNRTDVFLIEIHNWCCMSLYNDYSILSLVQTIVWCRLFQHRVYFLWSLICTIHCFSLQQLLFDSLRRGGNNNLLPIKLTL